MTAWTTVRYHAETQTGKSFGPCTIGSVTGDKRGDRSGQERDVKINNCYIVQ